MRSPKTDSPFVVFDIALHRLDRTTRRCDSHYVRRWQFKDRRRLISTLREIVVIHRAPKPSKHEAQISPTCSPSWKPPRTSMFAGTSRGITLQQRTQVRPSIFNRQGAIHSPLDASMSCRRLRATGALGRQAVAPLRRPSRDLDRRGGSRQPVVDPLSMDPQIASSADRCSAQTLRCDLAIDQFHPHFAIAAASRTVSHGEVRSGSIAMAVTACRSTCRRLRRSAFSLSRWD